MSIQQQIDTILTEQLAPVYLRVENESNNHNVPANSETHFKLVVVSDQFAGLRPVQRHQKIYGLLSEPLAGPVHALAIHTYSPDEWKAATVADSPQCMGGGQSGP